LRKNEKNTCPTSLEKHAATSKAESGRDKDDELMTKGVFGRAPNSSRFKKTAPLHFFSQTLPTPKTPDTKKQNLNLAPNSTKSMESLRGYSVNTVFERTREVVWKLPTIAIVYTGYRFVFFFLSRSHLLPVAQTDRCPS
jgi:hypothetical protein